MRSRYFIILLSVLFTFSGLKNIALAEEILAEASFSIENASYLEVEGAFCNVVLEGHAGSTLEMDAWIRGDGDPDRYEIIFMETNGRIKVWLEYPKRMWGHMEGLLKFKVPDGVQVVVNNSSGNVEARSLPSDMVRLEASSGNVYAENLRSELILKCTSGNVTLDGNDGNTEVRTSSGNQKIERIQGNVIAEASSGNIKIYSVNGNLSAECSSGNIQMREVVGQLDIKTTSGNIRGEDIKLNADSRFRASSGDITLTLLNGEEDLSFDLDAGSGNLYAAGSRAEDRLIIKQGGILITGITSSGNQRYSTD